MRISDWSSDVCSSDLDLDSSMNACVDLNAYANGKWLAANPVPGDRTSWGAFELLNARSIAVQHQLAEQAAADAAATGVKKIVRDFWATGMDEAKINAQGITPIQARLDALSQLERSQAICAYPTTSAARREDILSGSGPEAAF